MGKISSSKKIILEDFPKEVRVWLPKLSDPLNRFLEQVYASLVNGITLSDNIKSRVYRISIRAGETEKSVQWTLNERPNDVRIANIRTSADAAPSAAYSMSWKFVNGQIDMTFIGLDAGTKYTATIVGQV